jgi:hypothetical protein
MVSGTTFFLYIHTGHVGSGSDGYERLHWGFGFGKRNKEGDGILEFCEALYLVLGNTLFKKEIRPDNI